MSLGMGNNKNITTSRVILYVLIIGIALFLVWASSFEIERGIRAQGQIIASDRTQIVQSADTGIIYKINVKEGQSVKKGDVLVLLDKERASAAFTDTSGKVAALKVSLARLSAEVYGTELRFSPDLLKYKEFISNQTNLYQRRKNAIDEDVKTLNDSLELVQKELDMNMPLYKSGDISGADILKLQRQITDINGQITSKKNKYFQDAQTEMTKIQEELSTQEQTLLDRGELLSHTILVAPMDGIVKKVSITTVGGVVKQGDEVMELLPTESSLLVEAKIQPTDMSHLVIGLPALIKLDAYDYSIYGAMVGDVEYISPDALSEQTKNGEMIYYKAKIRIKEKELNDKFSKEIQINPGMTVTIDIKTGKRTVLDYLTKPITKTIFESMKEK